MLNVWVRLITGRGTDSYISFILEIDEKARDMMGQKGHKNKIGNKKRDEK